jgi:hypothetical protein
MTPKQAVAYVKAQGVVLESARGSAPSLAEAVAGDAIRGSWWAQLRAVQHELRGLALDASGNRWGAL